MKNRTLQLAGLLALLAVLGKFYAPPLLAQVRAALVQDRDEPARNFYQSSNFCSTPTSGFCIVDFPAVPANKRLIVQHVSAIMTMPAQNTITSVDLRQKSGSIGSFFAPIAAPANAAGSAYYSINEGVLNSFDTGAIPEFIVFTSSSATFTTVVTLSGYMIDLP